MDRYHSLAVAYQGFYADPEAQEDETPDAPEETAAAAPAELAQASVDLPTPTEAELRLPPYAPVMAVESARMPLGYAHGAAHGPPFPFRERSGVVLSDFEFGLLCALAGSALTLIFVSRRSPS